MTEEEKKEFEEFQKWKAEKAQKEKVERESEKTIKEEDFTHDVSDSENPKSDNKTSKDKNNSIWIPIIIGVIFVVLLLIGATKCSNQANNTTIGYEDIQTVDSIAEIVDEPQTVYYSAPIINRDSIIGTMKSDYVIKKDEFSTSGGSWVEPKSAPKYRNRNAFYCYFWVNDNNYPSNFRFVMQYEADSWLFIENCVFNIDGENVNYVPQKMQHDNNSRIWEWFDDQIDIHSIHLIRKIANAKSVKVKLNGQQYYDTRTIKASEIASIKKTLEKYEELGGSFN